MDILPELGLTVAELRERYWAYNTPARQTQGPYGLPIDRLYWSQIARLLVDVPANWGLGRDPDMRSIAAAGLPMCLSRAIPDDMVEELGLCVYGYVTTRALVSYSRYDYNLRPKQMPPPELVGAGWQAVRERVMLHAICHSPSR